MSTPLGNLGDITLRAIEILRAVPLIAAEDTRRTAILLRHYGISTPTTSYFEHNKSQKTTWLVQKLREQDVALVSAAGTPAVSDPGYELVRAALAEGIAVVPVPGPSAPVTALSVSGLPTDEFTFLGFLPRRATARRAKLLSVRDCPRTLIAFEAPHRVLACLQDVQQILGDRAVCVGREITKLHEEWYRGTVTDALQRLTTEPPRGELTLVLAGASATPGPTEDELSRELEALLASGTSGKDAVAKLAEDRKIGRRLLYSLLTKMRAPESVRS